VVVKQTGEEGLLAPVLMARVIRGALHLQPAAANFLALPNAFHS
jgi:hypothetical protein